MTRASISRINNRLHFQHVCKALTDTANKLRNDVEVSHKMGRIPADYSLGFTNAIIFADHKVNNRYGQPKFYDRTMAIGALPKPVALQTGNIMGREEIYQSLQETLILAIRNYRDEVKVGGCGSAQPMFEALEKMDSFVEQMLELEEGARLGKVGNGVDAPIENQGVATPPAPPTPSDHHEHISGDIL